MVQWRPLQWCVPNGLRTRLPVSYRLPKGHHSPVNATQGTTSSTHGPLMDIQHSNSSNYSTPWFLNREFIDVYLFILPLIYIYVYFINKRLYNFPPKVHTHFKPSHNQACFLVTPAQVSPLSGNFLLPPSCSALLLPNAPSFPRLCSLHPSLYLQMQILWFLKEQKWNNFSGIGRVAWRLCACLAWLRYWVWFSVPK